MTKRILTVVLAVLMLLLVAYPASAAIQATTVEVRGAVVSTVTDGNTDVAWDAQSFAGFYYDLKNDRSTEKLYFDQALSTYATARSVDKTHLWYTTGKAYVDFKANEKEGVGITTTTDTKYPLVGWQAERWIAVKNNSNKIAKLAFEMNKEDKKTLTTGETWALGSGYELTINAIDARTTPRQVWFTLKKDGAVVDEGIGQAPDGSTLSAKQKAVYYKTKTILGESDALLFTVYVDTIFSGATSDMVQFKYAWLIDESSAKEIKSADTFGVFEVRTANKDKIELSNENSVSLSKNSETTLMGNMKFKVADSDTLRFYPFVSYTNAGTYEVRGSVVDAAKTPTTMASWNPQGFAGFYYDLKNDRSTEKLYFDQALSTYATARSVDKTHLWYTTGKAYVDFKANEKEGVGITTTTDTKYPLVGWMAERWIAVKNNSNKIAKLAFEMNKEDKKTLTTGETWALGSGYELTINAIDARTTPRQVWFTLKKDGAVVDEGIGQAPDGSTLSAKQKAVYYKTKTILGESDALLFTVYVDTIFSGATSDMVQFKYAWLIDESSAKEIKSADTFGVFEVRTANKDKIELSNENSVSLSKNSETTLMGEIKFKVADSDTLRFYPKVDYVIGTSTTGTTAAPTAIGTAAPTAVGTAAPTAVGTAAPTAVGTAAPTAAATAAATATPTEPGFEAVFAIAGLLAVAFLVLRQRK
ncbi:MAG: S-layer protein domain-containing protein [Candidatus Methanoperedens sp.]